MWTQIDESPLVSFGLDDLLQENAELRKEKQELLTMLNPSMTLCSACHSQCSGENHTGDTHGGSDLTSEIDISATVGTLKHDLNATKTAALDLEKRLKQALEGLQIARVESLQVLPLTLHLNQLKNNLETITEELKTSKLIIEGKDHRISELCHNSNLMQREFDECKLRASLFEQQNEEISRNNIDLKVKVESFTADLLDKGNRLNDLESRFNELQCKYSWLYTEYNQYEHKCQSLAKDVARLRTIKLKDGTSHSADSIPDILHALLEENKSLKVHIRKMEYSISNNCMINPGDHQRAIADDIVDLNHAENIVLKLGSSRAKKRKELNSANLPKFQSTSSFSPFICLPFPSCTSHATDQIENLRLQYDLDGRSTSETL